MKKITLLLFIIIVSNCAVKTQVKFTDGKHLEIYQSSNQIIKIERHIDGSEIIKSETRSIGILESSCSGIIKFFKSIFKPFQNMFTGVEKKL